jgi:hypothetical protein
MKKMKLSDYLIRTGAGTLLFALISINVLAQDNKGNPLPHFLFPKFNEGIIKMKNGTVFNAILNYNMANEMMVSELNGTYRSANNPREFDTIYLQNRTFVPVENIFYELLVKGPVIFFVENKCNLTPRGSSVGYGMKSKSVGPTDVKRFELDIAVYNYNQVVSFDLPPNVDVTPASVNWVRKDNKMEKFTTKKQFLKLFPDKTAQLSEFIKREKIDIKSREDLIRLGKYCNEIMK